MIFEIIHELKLFLSAHPDLNVIAWSIIAVSAILFIGILIGMGLDQYIKKLQAVSMERDLEYWKKKAKENEACKAGAQRAEVYRLRMNEYYLEITKLRNFFASVLEIASREGMKAIVKPITKADIIDAIGETDGVSIIRAEVQE